jgi:hypothetical protein
VHVLVESGSVCLIDAGCPETAVWGRCRRGAPGMAVGLSTTALLEFAILLGEATLLWPVCVCVAAVQLRVHIEVATELRKPLILLAFAKHRFGAGSTMADRNAFYSMVYEEVLQSPIVSGASARLSRCVSHRAQRALRCATMRSLTGMQHRALRPNGMRGRALCLCLRAGSLFWLLAANSYPDYDGYTVYSTRTAASTDVPEPPPLTSIYAMASLNLLSPFCKHLPGTTVSAPNGVVAQQSVANKSAAFCLCVCGR